MKNLIEIYKESTTLIENFMFEKILPPLFRIMLFGMKITLIWAFYQMFVNLSSELF
jgi:hypothetical protein